VVTGYLSKSIMDPIHPSLVEKILASAMSELPDPLGWNEDYIFIPVVLEKPYGSQPTEIDCRKLSSKGGLIVEFKKEDEKGKKVRWKLVEIKEI